jgi:hypothetical protein
LQLTGTGTYVLSEIANHTGVISNRISHDEFPFLN